MHVVQNKDSDYTSWLLSCADQNVCILVLKLTLVVELWVLLSSCQTPLLECPALTFIGTQLSAVKAGWVFFGRICTSVACNSTHLCVHLWFIELPNHILHFPILEALRLHGDWFWVVNGSRSRIVSTNSFRTACKWKPWCGTTMWWVAGYCWAWNSDRMTVYTKCWCTLPCEELGLCETT